MYCKSCGKEISDEAVICPGCGVSTSKGKSKAVAALLCFFFGGFGVHRYYLGKVKSGIVQLILCCLVVGFIWVLIDFIRILVGSLTPENGFYM